MSDFRWPKSDEVKYKPYVYPHRKHDRLLILSDIHVPYHNPAALDAALYYGQDHKANGILINGDFLDCYAISSYDKNPMNRRFAEELKMGKEILEVIRGAFPTAHMMYVIGNHEERYEKYMFKKAPDLLGIDAFDMYQLLDAGHLGMDVVRDKSYIVAGKLTIMHGHEVSGGSGGGSTAKALYNKTRTHALCGHHHQTDTFIQRDIRDNCVEAHTIGCLCELSPAYRPINKYNHGFGFVEFKKNGDFLVHNKRIQKGLVV